MAKRWRRDELHAAGLKNGQFGALIQTRDYQPRVVGIVSFDTTQGWVFEEENEDQSEHEPFAVLNPYEHEIKHKVTQGEVIDVWIAVRNFVKRADLPTVSEDQAARDAEEHVFFFGKGEGED